MIGIKIKPETKEIIQKYASGENRPVANFVKHSVFTYLKEKYNVEIKEDEK